MIIVGKVYPDVGEIGVGTFYTISLYVYWEAAFI